MKILVIGGTNFLGRHVVEQSLAAGHEVTIFHRGETNPGLFGEAVNRVIGDRVDDIARLGSNQFDACVDTSGYVPAQLQASGGHLADKVGTYVFISSISVYSDFYENLEEDGPLAELPEDADPMVYSNENYGPLKVECERAIEQLMPGRVLHVRSGLIVGPFDPTNRFTYWPVRLAEGGKVLTPGTSLPVQIIPAADQARWILKQLADGRTGAFNVTSPNGTYTLADVINATESVTGNTCEIVEADDQFLLDNKVAPWMGLPLWLPGNALDMSRVSGAAALASGLELTPLDEVVAETLAWFRKQPTQDWPAGISREKESALLETLGA